MEKAVAGSFLTTASNRPWGSRPLLGIKDSSILYAVKTGHMTEYTRFNGCIGISSGCPCPETNSSVVHFVPDTPGTVTGIVFTVGSIIISWNAVTGADSYVITPHLNGALPSVTTSSTTYTFTNLQDMQPYTFTICAVTSGVQGPESSKTILAPPPILATILLGTAPPVDVSQSLLYVINAGLDYVLQYTVDTKKGPTVSSRLMYIWVASVVQGWNWVTSATPITGINDKWNWNTKGGVLSNCDAIMWICSVIDYITPLVLPSSSYKSIYNCSPTHMESVKLAGGWDTFLAAWTTWFNYRKADGSTSAVSTQPTDSANWNKTIVVNDVNNINEFPNPQQWTRLTINNVKQNYATYNWDSVLSTCLSEQDEVDMAQSISPAVGLDRDAEIDSVISITSTLTDTEKVQAEFWAGSVPGIIPPPLMCIWLWKEYVRCIGTTEAVTMYSLLDLAIHLFEGGRLTWRIKKQYMQDRPIQEIRRRYAGQIIPSWNGNVNGSLWVPYQTSDFVTPPFADFTSGHSNFTMSFNLVMTKWFGPTIVKNELIYDNVQLMSPLCSNQLSSFGDFFIPSGTSSIQPSVPHSPITLSFNNWIDIADSAGMSRLYGGIHTISAHTASQTIAYEVDTYINSSWNIDFTI